MKRLFSISTAAILCLSASPARATPTYPSALARELNLTASPSCSVCHTSGVTGLGTVNTAFGRAMREAGLVAYDEKKLVEALGKLRESSADSDADGLADLDELIAGANPNVPGGAGQDEPRYGCGAQSTGGGGALTALALLGLGVLLRRGTRQRGLMSRR